MTVHFPVPSPSDAIIDAASEETVERRRARIENVVTAIAATCVVLLIAIYSAAISLG